MKCTTTEEERMRPVEGCVFDVGSLYAQLDQLNDKRKARGKRYTLALVLTLIVLAKLSGEDRPWGIADWVQLRTVALREALGVKRARLPAHNTYRRVLRDAVEVEQLQT